MINKITEGLPDFEWPAWKSERDRIRHNSEKYKDIDCSMAFQDACGIRVKRIKDDSAYSDIRPGDIIELRILDVNKKGVVFDSGFLKETVTSAVNLYQYDRFKNRKWKKSQKVKCQVVSRGPNSIVVDPLSPMYNEWIDSKIGNIKSQFDVNEDKSIVVKGLKLVQGAGFQGAVRVDTVSDFCGQDVCTKAFIPGSQIVLNIEYDFDKWEGKEVRAFITNYLGRDGGDRMSLICSAKDYLKFDGDMRKIDIFDKYCIGGDEWDAIKAQVMSGVVTGVINNSKKQGVFVEVPEWNITGMIEMKPSELQGFRPGREVQVTLSRIDEPTYYNDVVGQTQHALPYVIENGILKKCSLRFVFSLA